ncbi:MAG: restriction endonuclease [Thermodesulfovibrionales bacterium]|jgi:restriction system protein
MARHRTSAVEDLLVIASKLPWWVSTLIALASYFILHSVASRPGTPAQGLEDMGNAAARGLWTALAMYGQYILPLVFGTGAVVSGFNSIRQKKLYAKVASRSDVSVLNEMSWGDFERLVGEYFSRSGFQVTREGGNGPDGGVDLVLRKGNEKHLVQCKQWKAFKVGVQPVREFYGVMAARGAVSGYFITSGEYTDEARAFVQGLNIELIDGRKLRKMIELAHEKFEAPPIHIESRHEIIVPLCPNCGKEMKKRVARQGPNAGKEFWGCPSFPKCNGTRPLE